MLDISELLEIILGVQRPLKYCGRDIDQCHRLGSLIYHSELPPCPWLARLIAMVRQVIVFYLHTTHCVRSFEGSLADDIRTNHLSQLPTQVSNFSN
jgi:hypothetical protein